MVYRAFITQIKEQRKIPSQRSMDIGYAWIYWQEKICSQFNLLIWTSFIGQFFSSSRRGGDGDWGWIRGYHYFSQLCVSLYQSTYKIWCNIQVIIYRLRGQMCKPLFVIIYEFLITKRVITPEHELFFEKRSFSIICLVSCVRNGYCKVRCVRIVLSISKLTWWFLIRYNSLYISM